MTSTSPLHLKQLTRTVPTWSKHLANASVEQVMATQRNEYVQADGQAYPWYVQATEAQRQALHTAMAQRNASRNALHKVLKPLKGITEFCKPLLEQRLAIETSVDTAVYFFQPFKRRPFVHVDGESGLTSGVEPEQFEYDTDGTPRKVTLLEAALHNFTHADEAGPYSELVASKTDGTRLVGWTVPTFIEACRELDLGKHYQEHLTDCYDGPHKDDIETLSIKANQDELRVQAHLAAMRDRVSSAGLAAIEQLCAEHHAPAYAGSALQCWRLSVLQTVLHEVLVIGPNEANQTNPCIVYIPGAPDTPVQEYPSANAAARALALRMQHEPLLQWIVKLAPQNEQADLAKRLREKLFDRPLPPTVPPELPKPNPRLSFITTALPQNPWARLQRAHVARLKADAATLAVPTAQVDAQARLALLEHALSVGLDLANVAALFLPGLNTVMLAIGAAQIMTSVFHGIEAWEQDDKAQAAAQLESVLLNLALIGAIGGGVALLKQSRFVDSLISIEHDGGERLWQPDLAGYASTQLLPEALEANEIGQFQHEGRHFVRLGGTLYEQAQGADGQWQILHSTDPDAYRPTVRHVADGGWRVEGEHPLDWDSTQLLKRLGATAERLDQADLDAALSSTGLDDDALRHAHVSETGTPPLLADALERLQADQEASDLIGRVRQGLSVAPYKQYALPSLVELPSWPEEHIVKVFNGPEPWGEATVYGHSTQTWPTVIELTRSDLDEGKLSQAILGQMDEDSVNALLPEGTPSTSRAGALDTLLGDYLSERRTTVFDSILSSRQEPLSSNAQGLKRQFEGVPNRALQAIVSQATPAERLRLAEGRVPLRLAEEARALQARARLDRAILGLHTPTLATADSQTLRTAILVEHPGSSTDQLFEHAIANRQKAAQWIGQQPVRPGYRSPLRLSDGRYGYPLSGRGGVRAWIRNRVTSIEERRLQELYPSLDTQQRSRLLTELRQRGNPAEQIAHLQRERNTLNGQLMDWVAGAEGETQENRELFRQALARAARRDDGNTLTLQHMTLETLPSLSARLDHITSLNILRLDLRSLPADFLQSFPRLQRLQISGNPNLQVDTLFQALRNTPHLQSLEVLNSPIGPLTDAARESMAGLTRLRALRLGNTGLVLGDNDLQMLAKLPLENLILRNNAITLDANMAARFAQMPRLRQLDLSTNPLGMAPDLGNLHQLQTLALNECDLQAWPEDLTTLMNRPDYALRNIELSSNAIHQLPALADILNTRYAQNLLTAHTQNWEFHFNELNPEASQQLRTAGVGVSENEDFLPEAQTVNWRATASDEQQRLWDGLFDNGSNRELREVIERVGRSAQARDNSRSLATQVWQLLEVASENQGLRERLNEVAGDFPPTCGDSGADGFSTLEIEALAYRESTNAQIPGPHLFQFYRGLLRREQVNVLAARIHAARLARQGAFLQWLESAPETRPNFPMLPALDELDDISLADLEHGGVDDIEIRLALRQALASSLEFPEPSRDMLYRDTAHISTLTEQNVEEAVLELDNDAATRQGWIAAQPSWQRFLKQRFAQRFKDMDARWYRGMEYLEYCLDPQNEAVTALDERVREALNEVLPAPLQDAETPLRRMSLNSQQYDDAVKRLASARQKDEDALFKTLTKRQDPNP